MKVSLMTKVLFWFCLTFLVHQTQTSTFLPKVPLANILPFVITRNRTDIDNYMFDISAETPLGAQQALGTLRCKKVLGELRVKSR